MTFHSINKVIKNSVINNSKRVANKCTGFCDGFTLIEAMIYISLLSLILSGFISFAFGVNLTDMQLLNNVNDQQYND